MVLDLLSPQAPAPLVGHSMGGNIACSYAGIRPERVRCVVNLEGFGLARTAPSPSGMGLKIMKYRADMIGAKFEIGSNEPHGATVSITG